MTVTLRGITWDHPLGCAPPVATVRTFEQEHPAVRIAWEWRSLQAFADQLLEDLAARYDLLVIDHPHVGTAAATHCLAPLHTVVAARCPGRSGGHEWALPSMRRPRSRLDVHAGGQPAHGAAWDGVGANALCHDFFRATRATLEGAWLRPRHHALSRRERACLRDPGRARGSV